MLEQLWANANVLVVWALFALVAYFVHSKVNAIKDATKRAWATMAVRAAENFFKGFKRGSTRRDWVVKVLKKRFPKLPDHELDVLIEWAVAGLTDPTNLPSITLKQKEPEEDPPKPVFPPSLG